MKNLRIVTFVLFSLLLNACSPDSKEVTPLSQDEQNLELGADATKGSTNNNTIDHEHGLAWAAFISAKILYNTNNTSERSFFNTNYGSQSYVSFDDLVGSSAQHLGFKNKFIDMLTDYIGGTGYSGSIGCPGDEDDTPGQPVVDGGDITVQGKVQLFLQFLLDDNCTELYFPVGMSLSGKTEVTAVAHPFAYDLSVNNGWRRFNDLGCENTEAVSVNDQYISPGGNENIIVGRLRKSYGVIQCTYPEYSNIDFTLFLDGPY
ncbi:MAG: hypothetical protein DWP94_12800 [Flavobacterium sp.]|nr:MAG: hypothetical protein DWP94_12800 [Flavobacterium sp.]